MIELNGSPFNVTTPFEAFYLVVEISQYLDLILQFFLEYHDEDRDLYVRDLLEISKNYAQGGLLFDFPASVPFFSIITYFNVGTSNAPIKGYNLVYIVYWLKALRFYKAEKIATPRYISNLVKNVYK